MIISLSTDSWWAVVAACAVHAVGTFIVASVALRVTTAVERVTPTTAAQLQEEGVGDPDQALSDMLERFGPGDDRGAADVVASGHNRVTARPGEDRGRAEAQQRTAITPASEPSEPSGSGGLPMVLPVVAVAASLLVAIAVAVAVFEGGIAWIGAALLLAASIGWLLIERRTAAGEHTDTPPRRPVLLTVALVLAAVIAGVIVVGAVGGYLA